MRAPPPQLLPKEDLKVTLPQRRIDWTDLYILLTFTLAGHKGVDIRAAKANIDSVAANDEVISSSAEDAIVPAKTVN
jgi:hypothetical protein